MRKIATAFDFLISATFIFLVAYVFFGGFLRGAFPVVISVFCTIFFAFLFFKIRGDVFKKKNLAVGRAKKQKLVETSLLYQTNTECLDFFCEFFQKIFNLEFSKKEGFLQSSETFVYPRFDRLEIDFPDLLEISKIAREKGAKHLIVPCLKARCNANFLSSMFQTVSIFSSQNLFDKMVEFDFFPKMIANDVLPKKTFSSVVAPFLQRKRAFGFGGLGCIMLFFSMISPFRTYYSLVGCILLLLSAFLILFRRS